MWLSALDGAWRVLAAGLLLGAGLPVLFALGVKSLAWANGDLSGLKANRAGKLVAAALFTVVVLAILLGIGYIVAHGFGYVIGWSGWLPTITQK